MSVIALSDIPNKVGMKKLVRRLAWLIKGEFEALNCLSQGKTHKICYVQLSERLDPQMVVQTLREKGGYKAYVPDRVPDLPPSKHGKLTQRVRRTAGICEQRPVQVFVWTNISIMCELQSKFSGLFNLSRKTGHQLLESIARTVMGRLKNIIELNPEMLESCFRLSSCYRRQHPHFGDFQMIMSTLHRLQDAVKVPRAQLTEAELTAVDVQPYVIENIPYTNVAASCKKYSDKIIRKIEDYIKELNIQPPRETDSAQEIAERTVRQELQNISPYLPLIIKQVIANHFVPNKTPFHRVTMFGEPALPAKAILQPFLKKYGAVKIIRSDRTFNMIRYNVPCRMVTALQQKDGSYINDCKLIIRASDIPLYRFPAHLLKEMKRICGDDSANIEEFLQDDREEENEAVNSWAGVFEVGMSTGILQE